MKACPYVQLHMVMTNQVWQHGIIQALSNVLLIEPSLLLKTEPKQNGYSQCSHIIIIAILTIWSISASNYQA